MRPLPAHLIHHGWLVLFSVCRPVLLQPEGGAALPPLPLPSPALSPHRPLRCCQRPSPATATASTAPAAATTTAGEQWWPRSQPHARLKGWDNRWIGRLPWPRRDPVRLEQRKTTLAQAKTAPRCPVDQWGRRGGGGAGWRHRRGWGGGGWWPPCS